LSRPFFSLEERPALDGPWRLDGEHATTGGATPHPGHSGQLPRRGRWVRAQLTQFRTSALIGRSKERPSLDGLWRA
jgi:hypothetical protein